MYSHRQSTPARFSNCLCKKHVYPNCHMAPQGFPPRDVLRTVYVEHDIDASEAETPVVDFVFADKALQGARALLADIGHRTGVLKTRNSTME